MDIHAQGDRANHSPQSYSLKRLRVVVLLLLVSLLVASVGIVSLRGFPKAHLDPTWTLVWSDDFNGAVGTGVNTSNWLYDTGKEFGTGEIETMSHSTANVQQDGSGHLKITAIRDGNGNWTSGRIESQRADFAAPVGGKLQVSASIQQPNISGDAAAGYWPAFWMLGSQFRVDHNWPNDGGIDIMEDVNGLSSVFGTLHCGVALGGPCNETNGIGSGQHACPDCQLGFHMYSMIVDRSVSPEQIRWYLDGANYFTINANQVDATTWKKAVDHGFIIIFDLAMGGDFPNAFGGGPTVATQSGSSMLVDNVQVSVLNGSGEVSAPSPTPPPPTPTTPSSPPSGNSFTQSASSVGTNQALLSFQPNGWSAGYVIAHYTVAGGIQQNVNMTYNNDASRWECTIGGLSLGNLISYSFTYQKKGLQYDTQSYSKTYP